MRHLFILAFLLSGCAIMDCVSSKRIVQVYLDGDIHGTVVYATPNGKMKYQIGELPINKPISFPNVPIEISIEYDRARYDVNPIYPLTVPVSETSAKQYFTFTDVIPSLKADYSTYPLEVRKALV